MEDEHADLYLKEQLAGINARNLDSSENSGKLKLKLKSTVLNLHLRTKFGEVHLVKITVVMNLIELRRHCLVVKL